MFQLMAGELWHTSLCQPFTDMVLEKDFYLFCEGAENFLFLHLSPPFLKNPKVAKKKTNFLNSLVKIYKAFTELQLPGYLKRETLQLQWCPT